MARRVWPSEYMTSSIRWATSSAVSSACTRRSSHCARGEAILRAGCGWQLAWVAVDHPGRLPMSALEFAGRLRGGGAAGGGWGARGARVGGWGGPGGRGGVAANDIAPLGRALDGGASGVIVPLVDTAEDAAAAV